MLATAHKDMVAMVETDADTIKDMAAVATPVVVVTDGLVMAVHRMMKVRWVETYMDTVPDLVPDLVLGRVMVEEDMTGARDQVMRWGLWIRRGGGAGSSRSVVICISTSRRGMDNIV